MRETGTGWPAEEPGKPADVETVHSGPDEDADRPDGDADRPPARRSGPATATIAILLLLLGFALVVQLKNRDTDAELESARPEDLVRILSDLDSQQTRLRGEISDLEDTKRQLDSGALGQEAALAEARRRADQLGILAGTLPAEGPGLEIDFIPGGTEAIRAVTILDAVEELRGAGAEAMQLSGAAGPSVRIVASSYFVDSGDQLLVDGTALSAPYRLTVIGDPQTMLTALNIPGGVVDTVRQHGGTVSVREADVVRVAALHVAPGLKHARPVS
jgi:uncharacterized protein YlxW (UPF0749 family)